MQMIKSRSHHNIEELENQTRSVSASENSDRYHHSSLERSHHNDVEAGSASNVVVEVNEPSIKPAPKLNPAPLGLCAFALTTFVLSMMNAGVIVDINSPKGVVMGLALFYGGMVQLLAGMWEFTVGNTFGTVAFTSYGGFWMSFAALNMNCFGFLNGYTASDIANHDLSNGLGIYLLAWCIFSFLMTIAAHRKTFLLMFLLFLVGMTFLMLAIGEFHHGTIRWQRAGGSFGIVAALLAWYLAFASMFNEPGASCFKLWVGEMDPLIRQYFGEHAIKNN